MDWHEVPAERVGMDPSGVAAIVRWVEACRTRGLLGAQLVVLRRGQVVLDRSIGLARRRPPAPVTPRTVFLLYSLSKPYIALLIHLLAERGLIALDDPVARYWPEFGRHGKESITIRHVLQHRAGVPLDTSPLALLAMPIWEHSVQRMEQLRPRHPPGERAIYHVLTYGYILGEIIRRVTGTPVREFLARNLLGPLDLWDTFLGLPSGEWNRRADIYASAGLVERGSAIIFNTRRYRQAVIPAASISSTARDVALFHEMLRRGGELGGVRVLSPQSIAEARRLSTEGERDQSTGWHARWGHGFQLGGASSERDLGQAMGFGSHPETFGFSGSQCCLAWVDPSRELVFAYLSGRLLPGPAGLRELAELSDTVLLACHSQ